MPSLSQQIESLLKPLRLEIRTGFTNRSVAKGLDRFVMERCSALATVMASRGDPRELRDLLGKIRSDFSQYMTLNPAERKELVNRVGVELGRWSKNLAEKPKAPVTSGKLSLSDPILPFIPREKTKAFHLTKLKTVDDLLHYAPKWVLDSTRFTPLGQCTAREEPYFLKARINGISQNRRGHLEILKVNLEDESGHMSWVWYNRPYLKKELMNGRWVILHETPQVTKWGRQVVAKAETFEFLSPEDEKTIGEGKAVVFYPSTPTLTQDFWRQTIQAVLLKYAPILPASYQGLHLPGKLEEFEAARRALAHEELLLLQAFLLLKRKAIERREKGRQYKFEGDGTKVPQVHSL